MAIDEKRVAAMKRLVEDAKKSDKITPFEKAFELYLPGGIWRNDENGTR